MKKLNLYMIGFTCILELNPLCDAVQHSTALMLCLVHERFFFIR